MTRDEWIPDLVSKTEAGEILGVSRQAVEQMVAKDQLRGAQAGTTWVFRREAVEALRQRRAKAAEFGTCPACGVTKYEFPAAACSDPDGWHARTYPEA